MAPIRWAVVAAALLLAHRPTPGGAARRETAPAFVAHRHRRCGGAFAHMDNSNHCNSARGHQPTHFDRPRSWTARASTTARNDGGPRAPQRNYDVLYQKVLRAPPSSSSAPNTLLLDVVSYLQYVYRLPGELPMPYELALPDDSNSDDRDGGERAVLIIDSPLGNDGEARLEAEVVGIFPDDTDVAAGAPMAMVALKKRKDATGSNGVSGELFAASERRIVQSLDRGLQQLEEGRVTIPQSTGVDADELIKSQFEDDDEVDAAMKRLGYKNAVDAAKSSTDAETNGNVANAKEPLSIERDGLGNVVIDSPAKPVSENDAKGNGQTATPSAKQTRAERDDKVKAASRDPRREPENDEYAVRMARRRAEALMSTGTVGSATSAAEGTFSIKGGEGDFAVLAAKRAAEARSNGGDQTEEKTALKGSETGIGKRSGDASLTVKKQPTKRKVQDLSNDATFLKLQSIASEAKRSSWQRTISKAKKGKQAANNPPKISGVSQEEAKRIPTAEKPDVEIQDDVLRIAQQNEQVQRELRAATDMMPVEKEGEGLSPEELLADILKFGEEQEQEEKPGRGFVEGAFGKAKELLREGEVEVGTPSAEFREGESPEEKKRRLEEEELRRIFSAGQSVAENRMSQPAAASQASSLAKPSITEEDIDALIDADDTVPLNARVLDDELAELEVRLSRSAEEASDGPPRNELFDVFSGPEVYNPNVDPETAVNWPGAKKDTRTDVRLARDLSTALKQAQFAAAVLSQMREEGEEGNDVKHFVGTKEISPERVTLLRQCVHEAVRAGIIEDPEIKMVERSRLQMLVDELTSQPEERLEEIAMNYKDLLLSDNLVDLIKERLHNMAMRDVDARRDGNEDRHKDEHAHERAIMMNLAQIAQVLVKEAQALGAELEVSMLEIIRSICEVAMDPSHKSEEDTAVALTDAVKDMRPLLDDAFVAYLKYAIAEEEGKLARAGLVDDPEHNRWLFVLKIVQEGVYNELSQGVKRYVDHIWYVLRMKSKAERRELLKKLIDAMPTMDVRPFVKVVNNIVASLGTTVKGDFSDGVILGDMTNQLLQLQKDVNDILPPDRINELSEDADAWAATQRQRLLERRNVTRQRLEAARQTGDIDPDEVIKKPGAEAERFD